MASVEHPNRARDKAFRRGRIERDQPLADLRRAELERALGNEAWASGLLLGLEQVIDPASEPFLFRRIHQEAARLGDATLAWIDDDRLERLLARLAEFPVLAGTALGHQASWCSSAPAQAAMLTERAVELLSAPDQGPTTWLGTALGHLAVLYAERGDETAAAQANSRSREVFAPLGWPAQTVAPDDARRAEVRITLDIDPDGAILVVATTPGPGDGVIRRLDPESELVRSVLGESTAEPRSAEELMWDSSAPSPGHGRVRHRSRGGGDRPGVADRTGSPRPALQAADRRLGCVPWELMRLPDETLVSQLPTVLSMFRRTARPRGSGEVQAVQRVLNQAVRARVAVDGVLGPATQDALSAFQRTR